MEARRDLECKIVPERRRKASPMILKEQKKVTVERLAKLKAKRNRIGELKRGLKEIECKIDEGKENNKHLLKKDALIRRRIDQTLNDIDILDEVPDQRDFVTACLSQSLSELMGQQNEQKHGNNTVGVSGPVIPLDSLQKNKNEKKQKDTVWKPLR